LRLDCGAAINDSGGWLPLEELYWNSRNVTDLLLGRGASIHKLRIAAGLGRMDVIERKSRNPTRSCESRLAFMFNGGV
jgi:hypothetical protein